jgi:hypothetical protein
LSAFYWLISIAFAGFIKEADRRTIANHNKSGTHQKLLLINGNDEHIPAGQLVVLKAYQVESEGGNYLV